MAHISVGLPHFAGTEEDDLELFIDLFRGQLDSLGVDPLDRAGNPTGAKRAVGLLRSCMLGRAATWFDRELSGKNWKLAHMNKNPTQAGANPTMAQLRLLNVQQGAAGGMANGTYIAGTPANAYSADPANVAVTVAVAFIPSDAIVGRNNAHAVNEIWRRIGGQPTSDAPNAPRNAGAGNGAPIVLPGIHLNQALFWMRDKFPTILEEKRRLNFGTLSQDNLPIRDYFEKVERSAQLLDFPPSIMQNQFFRGLSPENMIEVERIGMGRPLHEIVDTLDRVEKRKSEMMHGLTNRKERGDSFRRVEAIPKPPVSQQEPAILKPVTSHAITQDMLNELLHTHTKNITENLTNNFQTQLQALQEKVARPPARAPPVPPKNHEQIHRFYEGGAPNPFDDDREYSFEEIMGADYKTPPKVIKIAQRVAKKLAQAEERRQDRELARAMQGLNIDDRYPEPMDTSNLVSIGDVEVDADDLNVYIANLIRSQKKR